MSAISTNQSKDAQGTKSDGDRRHAISEMKRDAHAVKEDLEVLKEDTAQLASHATSHAIDAVKCGAQSATEFANSSSEKLKEYHIAVNKQVRARPTASVLLALGAGVMIGRVLSATRR